jgi:transcriptional regulator with GAF, ATPase, and Fis domain
MCATGESESMLRIGLIGTLGEQCRVFSKNIDPSIVEFSRISPKDRFLKLDLVLGLRGDRQLEDLSKASREPLVANASVFHFWPDVPDWDHLEEAVQDSLADAYGFVVGYSQPMHSACRWIRSVAHQASAALDLRTLIVGETGTGKELVARAIHHLGARSAHNLKALNCSAMPEGLLEAELFGHVRGAFTGAVQDRTGALAAAGEGTVFLDEVGDLPLSLQATLLRVLEQRSFSPVGSNREIPFKAQVLSATNHDLSSLVESQTFRADLYFRLAQVCIPLPPLRERVSDLPILVRHFLRQHKGPNREIDEISMNAMRNHSWPGNIRELRVAIEKYLLLSSMSDQPRPEEWLTVDSRGPGKTPGAPFEGTLAELRSEFEKSILKSVLVRCNGDTIRAARELGVTRRSVYNLARRHGIELREPD